MKLSTNSVFPLILLNSLFLSLSSQLFAAEKNASEPQPQSRQTGKIIGGDNAVKGDYPFITALVSASSTSINPFCGAAYIGDRYVLTAAHCVNGDRPENIDVWIGGHNTNIPAEGQRISVQQIYMHEEYEEISFNKDIAVLELTEVVTGVEPLKLLTPQIEATINEGDFFTIMGWGDTDANQDDQVQTFLPILQEADVPLYNRADCQTAYDGTITEFMMCAGFVAGGRDTCQGDSGGPMIYRHEGEWYQAGVVSFGNGCALANNPGIYSRVTQFLDWVEQKKEGVSYQQTKNIGFVENNFSAQQTIEITNITNAAFTVNNPQLQNITNLTNLNISNDSCDGASLAVNQSCSIVVETTSSSLGASSFTLVAQTSTPLSTPVQVNVSLTSIPSISIDMASAVGSDDNFVTWFTGGDRAWQLQTSQFSDGTSSVSNGDIDDSESSILLAKITTSQSALLTYKYLTSSEVDFDFLNVSVNGQLVDSFSGTDSSVFLTETIALTPGTNRVSFSFDKDGSVSSGDDLVFIDGVSLSLINTNPSIMLNQTTVNVEESSTFTLDASGTTDPDGDTLTYSWSVLGNAAATIANPNAISTTITAPAFSNASSMTIRLTVTDGFGGSAQSDIAVTITQAPASMPVTPVAAPPASSGGGGGGISWAALMFLGIIGFYRRLKQGVLA